VSPGELAAAAGLGLGLGVVTGMPLGVVNVAIIDAAARGRMAFAIGIGLGGAFADAVHAALAFVGAGRLAAASPAWTRAMGIAAAVLIAGYAIAAWRGRAVTTAPPRAYGVVTGVLLTLPNPAALAAWLAVAVALWPTISTAGAIVLALGVGLGSAAWFTVLARWIAALPLDHRFRRVAPRVAILLLVAIAALGVVRAAVS
jgi:threonine/homoserine/homoserine lactone efflux protein